MRDLKSEVLFEEQKTGRRSATKNSFNLANSAIDKIKLKFMIELILALKSQILILNKPREKHHKYKSQILSLTSLFAKEIRTLLGRSE